MLNEPTTKKRYNLRPYWGDVPAGSDQALRKLARAVIIQAARDANGPEPLEAFVTRLWLTGEDCEDYCLIAGVNFQAVKEWVEAGCPKEAK